MTHDVSPVNVYVSNEDSGFRSEQYFLGGPYPLKPFVAYESMNCGPEFVIQAEKIVSYTGRVKNALHLTLKLFLRCRRERRYSGCFQFLQENVHGV